MRGYLISAIAAAMIPSAASATYNHGGGHGGGGGSNAELQLRIFGKISPKCEISLPNRRIQTVLTDDAGSESVNFRVNCNQELSVTMTSANGGFEHPTRDRGENYDGFLNLLPYRATFSVNADDARAVVAKSEDMIAGAGGSIGTVPFKAKGKLELTWDPELPLLGGTFVDVIEIRVSGAGETHIPRW